MILQCFGLGMKIPEWYIDPNDTKDKNFAKYPYPNGIIICEIHIIIPEWYQLKTIPDQH